jgi:hypothetical protein
MPRSYGGAVSGGTVTANINFLGFNATIASPTLRGKLFEFVIGSGGVAPADNASKIDIARMTALPTGGTVTQTPYILDPLEMASENKWYAANTGAGTKSTVMMSIGLNQRATFRWVAAPTKEIQQIATQNYGIGIFLAQTSAYVCDATIYWEE